MILAVVLDLWSSAWPAGVMMLGLGGGFALVLLVASEKLKVQADPKVEQIKQALPNLDCGACGFAGCAQYAKAVGSDPGLLGACSPGGAKTSAVIARILNLQVSDSGPARKPIVHCNAHTADKTRYGTYEGIRTCAAANTLAGVQACRFGCLGFGDCVRACRFDALAVVDGLATVDYDKCTGCAACSKACPRNLIEMVPFKRGRMMTVACRSLETPKATRSMCKVGCIGCGLCAKASDMFSVQDNLARLDYGRYEPDEQTDAAMSKCPTKVIVWRGSEAVEPARPGDERVVESGGAEDG